MYIGHYSAAFVAKSAQPKIPLWVLFLAAQFVDIFWAAFVLTGVEKVRIVPGLRSNPFDLYHMPYTHSLLATLLWGLGAMLLAKSLTFLRLSWKEASVVGITVSSHWLLDLLVHRPDLSLYPGHKVGFGLWNYPMLAFSLEMVLFALSVGLFLWWACPPTQRRKMLFLVGGMCGLQIFATFGKPPHQLYPLILLLLFSFLALPWLARRSERPLPSPPTTET
ncbi:MAG: hypothetical protein H6728_06360 [Myxococcales bacterium]|nr:hypothetical protein [Myxococcales bacterium]MCB9642682.1 hypothetical protein [Myxococcales bacterium]